MSRLKSNQRHAPTDLDDNPDQVQSYEFDYTHQGGSSPWPEKHGKIKFGPSLIRQAWAAGFIVFAEIDRFPHPVAVKEAQWTGGVLEVKTLDGPRIPRRLFTRASTKGLTVGGLLIEGEG